ncbi:MAG: translation initiation factor 2 [Lachnospiraceae bacterium]|nr:translation initiation factor 2 [Lachnospiraceae bacterium]
MKYDIRCPFCGSVNRGLYLDETGGSMECSACGKVTRGIVARPFGRIPVYTLSGIPCRTASAGQGKKRSISAGR